MTRTTSLPPLPGGLADLDPGTVLVALAMAVLVLVVAASRSRRRRPAVRATWSAPRVGDVWWASVRKAVGV